MNISDKGVEFIAEFEGYHRALPNGDCTTYYCPAGVLTIGYGCTEGIKAGEVWTKKQALDRFRQELAKHEAAVNRVVTVDMTQNQFDALVSFSYNLGTGALAASSIVKQLNAGKPEAAAKFFNLYCNARVNGRMQKLPGLVRRRAAETAMFLQPDAASEEPDMPQKVMPLVGDVVAEAHAEKKEESPIYAYVNNVRQLMGFPTLAAAVAFFKENGMLIMACALIVVIAVEAYQHKARGV